MSKLANLIRYFPTVLNARVLDYLSQKKTFSVSGMSNHTSKVFTVIDALRETDGLKGAIWIVNSPADIDLIGKDIKIWSEYEVRYFDPKVDTNLASKIDRLRRIKLIELLALIRSDMERFLVIPYFDLLKRIPDLGWLEKAKVVLQKGKSVDLMNLYESLIAMGYEISDDAFLAKGSYYRNGDMLTIFPVNAEYPVRVDIGFDKI
ncbi:hypothetical protein IT412_02620, partial [Candidatus Peregrinibacteria bacterium]|nr:hypothetical protein [Candidatus Peregrinibacteria bacterium]